jgi:hypothetical protein
MLKSMDTPPSQDTTQKEITADKEERTHGNDYQNGPSADFVALIETITAEGRAYRKEEQREDRGKKFREWVTIILIGMTFGAVCYQVYEMIKVYEPIKDQAKAATEQATAAGIQAENAKQSVATARDSMIAAQRAWVGPISASIVILLL